MKKTKTKKHTTKKDSANLLAEKPSLNLSSKKQNKVFQSIKQNDEKNKIRCKDSNKQTFSLMEVQDSLTKSDNTTVVPDVIQYEFLKQLYKTSVNYLLEIYDDI